LDTGNYDKKIEFFDTKKNKNVAQNAIPPAYAKLIKGKFANFNKHFKEAYQLQKNFAVPDSDLRGQLRSESVDIIIPMFENFVNKYGDLPFSTKHKHEYMCYTKELLETLLNKFFDELT
jgi:exocyst complex protein 7